MSKPSVSFDFPQAGIRHLRPDSRADFEQVGKMMCGFKQDAGLTVAFARQLEHIFAKAYEALFNEYRVHDFFPTNTEVEAGALSYTYRMIERVGNAAVVNSGNAKDLPNIDLGAQEWQQPVITLGASYNFSVINQLSGAMMNFSVEAEKAKATRQAIEALEESIYCTGFASGAMGVVGVTNAPGVATVTQASTGTWISQILTGLGTAPLSSALVTALASDLLVMKHEIASKSNGRHRATNVLLPPNLYFALDIVPESPLFNSKTLLTWLEDLTGLDIDYWPILLNAGLVSGSPQNVASVSSSNPQLLTRVVVYEKNPKVMQIVQVQPFVQLAPQPTGMVWEVPCYSRIGGALGIRPVGLCIMDGL